MFPIDGIRLDRGLRDHSSAMERAGPSDRSRNILNRRGWRECQQPDAECAAMMSATQLAPNRYLISGNDHLACV